MENQSIAIVGAGPVGMMTALLLARHGVASTVFERKEGISTHPKAMGVSRRSAEVYRQAGLLEAIRERSLSVDGRWLAVWSTTLVGGEILGQTPITEPTSALTPCQSMHSPQTVIEEVLIGAIEAEPLAQVLFRTEVTKVEQGAEKVQLTLSTGETRTFDWVVAADGAGSHVRRDLGIEAHGPGDMGHFINTMFRADYGPLMADRPAFLYQVLSPEYFEFFVAVDGKEIWLMHQFLQPGEKVEDFTKERLEETIRYVSGAPEVPVEVLSLSPWVMSPKVAETFRRGRIFLVGDAAARLSPAGGLGLNTGIQSAHNLAWKLAWVAKGRADESLLESYGAERQGTALRTMQNTNSNATEIWDILQKAFAGDMAAAREMIAHSRRGGSGLGQDLGVAYENGAFVPDGTAAPEAADPINDYVPDARPGARAPHLWLEGGRRSILDAFGDDFCLVTADAAAWGEAAERVGLKCIEVPTGAEFGVLYGVETSGAVLVRPDGYVGARWATAPAETKGALSGALETILGK